MSVSNNIGFLINQFGQIQTAAGGFKGAMKQLLQVMKGPGGMIVAGSLVLAGIQAMSMVMGQGKEVAAAYADSIEKLTTELKGMSAQDIRKSISLIQGAIDGLSGTAEASADHMKNVRSSIQATAVASAALPGRAMERFHSVLVENDELTEEAVRNARAAATVNSDAMEILEKMLKTAKAQEKAAEAIALAERIRLGTLDEQRGLVAKQRILIEDLKKQLADIQLTEEQRRKVADDLEAAERRMKELTATSAQLREKDRSTMSEQVALGELTIAQQRKQLEAQLALTGLPEEQRKIQTALNALDSDAVDLANKRHQLTTGSRQAELDALQKIVESEKVGEAAKLDARLKIREIVDEEAKRTAEIGKLRGSTIQETEQRLIQLYQVERQLILATEHDKTVQAAKLANLDFKHQEDLRKLEAARWADMIDAAETLGDILQNSMGAAGDDFIRKLGTALRIAGQIAKALAAAQAASLAGESTTGDWLKIGANLAGLIAVFARTNDGAGGGRGNTPEALSSDGRQRSIPSDAAFAAITSARVPLGSDQSAVLGELSALREAVTSLEIQVPVVLEGTLEGQAFLRKSWPDFERHEQEKAS